MDPAEIRFIRKCFIKERGAEVLEKSARPPSCDSPLKVSRHPLQLLAIRISQRIGRIHPVPLNFFFLPYTFEIIFHCSVQSL